MYNIRVYGLVIKDNAVLVSDEFEQNLLMTKFPGGGHQLGESLPECLQRELMEEMNLKAEITSHFYTTDVYVSSLFNSQQQLISIYYLVNPLEKFQFKVSTKPFDFEMISGAQSFRWISLSDLRETDFTFEIDKKVALMLKNSFKV